jgi:hypothetical protein
MKIVSRKSLLIKSLLIKLLPIYVVMMATSLGSAQTPAKTNDADKRAEQEVRQVSAEEVKAFLDKDPKKMAALWSSDFVVTNPLNKFATGQQVLGMMNSGFLIITAYDRQTEYAKVYGNTVILAGKEIVTWGGKMPNAGKVEHLRFTAVWMKRNGRWQEVARHANVVPQMPVDAATLPAARP